LTLFEIQELGRELEIPPDAVAQAARSVEQSPRRASQRFLGLPIGVERTIALNRWVTEEEWQRLVGELRAVFRAPGKETSHGSVHQWSNGNLHALLEPTATGHRLRFWTLKSDARASMVTGLAILGVAAAVGVAAVVAGQLGPALPGIALLSMVGLGMVANGALRVPGWARLRGRQMDSLGAGLAFGKGPQPPASPRPDRE
jgi:hypothetical protein